ncbi:hypothetical protein WN48_06388 [Eufriesea mexicana]|uniref:Ig-like domain-containing protein n=1 Tax=Eufriesea mexicana TaxID=516756 RepID=A0A310S3Y0_9HYME|nr:hypothetical protein WN48_06388 [Eufriesea mexicana]
MLNYIFDAHSTLNKHQHHHDHRWGPHIEGESKNMTIQAGGSALLDCRISLLQDKTVSWVRRQDNGQKVNLLTVGQHSYIRDPRYTVKFQYPDNWRLQIKPVNSSDEGQYECQISTHPPKYILVNLHINAPSVQIVDALGEPLRDKYYEADSTIELLCVVRHIAMQVQYSVVQWLHGNRILNYDTTRGGISVKTDLMEEGANSTLSIARVGPADSGNYTCHLTTMPNQPATIHVHVLNDYSIHSEDSDIRVEDSDSDLGPRRISRAVPLQYSSDSDDSSYGEMSTERQICNRNIVCVTKEVNEVSGKVAFTTEPVKLRQT